MPPSISVVLTTYNGFTRGYLSQAIESVLSQTLKDFELLIIDDGSTDETSKTCAYYKDDERVKYVYQCNQGLASARNTGIKSAQGDYICFLDDDDLYEPQKLELQLNAFTTLDHPSLGLVYTSHWKINAEGNITGLHYHPLSKTPYKDLFYGNRFFCPSSVMIKRTIFDTIGLFDESFRYCEDYELWLRISKHYEMKQVNKPLVKYRVHSNSATSKIGNMHEYRMKVIKKALSTADDDVQLKSDEIMRHHFLNSAGAFLTGNEYHNFRLALNEACTYGNIPVVWKIKYFFSFLPPLYSIFKRLKRLVCH